MFDTENLAMERRAVFLYLSKVFDFYFIFSYFFTKNHFFLIVFLSYLSSQSMENPSHIETATFKGKVTYNAWQRGVEAQLRGHSETVAKQFHVHHRHRRR